MSFPRRETVRGTRLRVAFEFALDALIRPKIAHVVRVSLREAGTRLSGEPVPTIVVLDMRVGNHAVEGLLAFWRPALIPETPG